VAHAADATCTAGAEPLLSVADFSGDGLVVAGHGRHRMQAELMKQAAYPDSPLLDKPAGLNYDEEGRLQAVRRPLQPQGHPELKSVTLSCEPREQCRQRDQWRENEKIRSCHPA